MKRAIAYTILAAILLSFSIAHAAPLKSPSRGTIVKLIKEGLLKRKIPAQMGGITRLDIVGVHDSAFSGSTTCNQPTVKSIKILRVGSTHRSSHEQSGNYIDSWFRVKFKVKGSCKLESPVETEYLSGRKVKGRLPFRNIPLETTITTDDYGDWYANEFSFLNYRKDGPTSKSGIKYIENIYYLQNKDKIEATKQAEQARIQKKKKIQTEIATYEKERATKKLGIRERLAAIKREMLTTEDFGNFQKLENSCKKTNWQYCPGESMSGMSLHVFEGYYVPLARAQKKYKGRIVKKLFMTSRTETRTRADSKRFQIVLDRLLNQYPTIKKAYNSLYIGNQDLFDNALYYQKTGEARRLVLLELGKQLTGKNTASIQTVGSVTKKTPARAKHSFGGASLRHSHAGRFHSHKLPPQGKAHRHGNSAVGR